MRFKPDLVLFPLKTEDQRLRRNRSEIILVNLFKRIFFTLLFFLLRGISSIFIFAVLQKNVINVY